MDERHTFSMAGRSASVEGYRYRLPFASPLQLGGTSHAHREGLLVRIRVGDEEGWGEVAPLPGFSGASLATCIEACRTWANEPDALGDATVEWEKGGTLIHRPGPPLPPSAAFGVESALLDIAARHCSASLVAALGGARRARAPVNALTTAASDTLADALRSLHEAGYATIKIKVGRDTLLDEARRIRNAYDTVGTDITLRLDANRAWSMAEACRFAEALSPTPIAFIEEPLADPSKLAEFVERTGWRVALDETVREITPSALATHTYATAVVLKPSLTGLSATLRWMDAAAHHGLRVVLSSAYESGIGMRILIALAARLPTAEASGFGPYRRLAADVITPRLSLDGPSVDVEAASAEPTVDVNRLERVF
jgi:O-succinylbenzoate synthase